MELTVEQNQLIEQNMGLVHAHYLKHVHNRVSKNMHISDEEMFDLCVDALVKSVVSYDSTKGKLSTLFEHNITHAVSSKVRYYKTQKRTGEVISMDKQQMDSDEEINLYNLLGIEDKYSFENKEWINKSMETLTPLQKTYIHLHFERGIPQQDIAETYQTTRQNINNLIRKALRKMRTYLEEVGITKQNYHMIL